KTYDLNGSILESWFQKYGNNPHAHEFSESKIFIKVLDESIENDTVDYHSSAIAVNIGSAGIDRPRENSEACFPTATYSKGYGQIMKVLHAKQAIMLNS
ncbi:MAG: hypothetical protein PQJ47_07370, partial [Sphaerochaetaceae bacterium]|nr:hypothetical protein [Sphaerochaetaceae bacterium]